MKTRITTKLESTQRLPKDEYSKLLKFCLDRMSEGSLNITDHSMLG